jgi:putative CocE/NonD family hydrolase
VRERYDRINVPALHIAGWYDVFISGSIRNFIELNKRRKEKPAADRAEQKLIVGPWFHLPWKSQVGCCDFGADAANIVNTAQLNWFDQHLKGIEEEKDDSLDVSIFVMNSNKWHSLDDWPPHTVYPTQFYIHSNGRANTKDGDGTLSRKIPSDEPWDSFIYDPANPVFSIGGHSCCFDLVAPMGPCDQRPNQARNDVLVYTTEPFHSDTKLLGQIHVKLFAASTAYDTDFTVTVSEVHTCGKAINLVNGILRASRRESLIHPRKIEPGTVYEYNIKVGWTAALIKRGNRIRLELSSSNFPHYNINPNTGMSATSGDVQNLTPARQTIFHDSRYPSYVALPISTGHDF